MNLTDQTTVAVIDDDIELGTKSSLVAVTSVKNGYVSQGTGVGVTFSTYQKKINS